MTAQDFEFVVIGAREGRTCVHAHGREITIRDAVLPHPTLLERLFYLQCLRAKDVKRVRGSFVPEYVQNLE